MKNIWKWILGIILVLVVAAGLFGLGFVHRTRMVERISRSDSPNLQMRPGPMRGGFPDGAHPDGRMFPRKGPMTGMRGFGRSPGHFMPGMMFFGMFGRLIPVAVALLLLYGAYQLGKGRSAPVAAPAAPTAPAAVPISHPCTACGNAVQDDWKHCPNCGEKQA